MAARSNARAGRFSLGEVDLNSSWTALSSDISRENERAVADDAALEAVGGLPPPSSLPFGYGQSAAEVQLYAYLDRVKEARPAPGFAPFEELSARLGEFSAFSQHRSLFGEAQAAPVSEPEAAATGSEARVAQLSLAWFEHKFDDLKSSLLQRDAGKSELAAVNDKLDGIASRVEDLASALPGERSIAVLETQLASLGLRFDAARAEARLQSSRISRTAKEILETASRVEKMHEETADALTLTAEQVTAALDMAAPVSRLEIVEDSLRGLTSSARASSDRTVEAVDRVHDMLRDFLQQGAPIGREERASAPPKKRMAVHMPIAAGAPAFTRSSGEFGTRAGERPRIDALTARTDPETLAEAIPAQTGRQTPASSFGDPPSFLREKRGRAIPQSAGNAQTARRMPYADNDDDRAFPVAGLAAVAVVLLLASAALYYLHAHRSPERWSMLRLPAGIARETVRRREAANPARPAPQLESKVAVAAAGRGLPVLLTAAEDWRPVSSGAAAAQTDDDVRKLTEAAAAGDRDAQYKVGIHFLGESTLPDNTLSASRWLSRAAAQGHPDAQFALASLLEKGTGIERDEARAIGLYREAANGGHARAMHNLGVLLISRGAAHDYLEAASWFATAAAAGVAGSQYNLAVLHEKGLGAPKDDAKAYFWFLVAARSGDGGAQVDAERLRVLLAPSVASEAAKDALSWLPVSVQAAGWLAHNEVRG